MVGQAGQVIRATAAEARATNGPIAHLVRDRQTGGAMLRRLLGDLGPRLRFDYQVAVLPITVASLASTSWIARHLAIPEGVARVILPGLCPGELSDIPTRPDLQLERGPADLRDLPEFLGSRTHPIDYGAHDIAILAEINHAPRLTRHQILTQARAYRDAGADWIDLGCDPGDYWTGVGEAVKALREEGLRVSIDSFDTQEVAAAVRAGAELVLSVNGSNVAAAADWGVEVVAIPDEPANLDSLHDTIDRLRSAGVRFRLDPILEPIGFGFAASLGRYLEMRRQYPDFEMMMGVGNLTELTDVDSAGVNVVLLGFCQELGIRSVLTTEVANWCRSSVKELDLARRLVCHAYRNNVLPKYLEPNLLMLRDPKCRPLGLEALDGLAAQLTDPNFRIFAEEGRLHAMNGAMHVRGVDPFVLFDEMNQARPIDASHAFYLGYEMAKAVTALTLGKNYTQDQALRRAR